MLKIRKIRKNKRQFFTYLAVIGLLIFLHFINVLKPLENLTVSLFNSFSGSVYSLGSKLRINYNEQTDRRDLNKVINDLEAEVERLTAEKALLENMSVENEKLRFHLKFLEENNFEYVLANIISEGDFLGSVESEKVIKIDKGSDDGLKAGLAVVNENGIVVGKLANVQKNMAEVFLTTDSNCKLTASIQNSDRTVGVTEGEMGLTIKMNFIPQTEVIYSEDLVVTSGLDSNIPRGLLIGKVMQVNQNNNEVWQNAVIEPLVDTDDLMFVSVLLN